MVSSAISTVVRPADFDAAARGALTDVLGWFGHHHSRTLVARRGSVALTGALDAFLTASTRPLTSAQLTETAAACVAYLEADANCRRDVDPAAAQLATLRARLDSARGVPTFEPSARTVCLIAPLLDDLCSAALA